MVIIFNRSDHLSKHIKTHSKNRTASGGDGSLINSTKLELDDDDKMIKTEVDASDTMCTDDEDDTCEMGEDGDGDGELEDQDHDEHDEEQENNEEMMITINTEGEQPELIISDAVENQA